MSDPTRSILSLDDLRDLTSYDFTVLVKGQARTIRLRRLDMFTRFMEGSIPQPLFQRAVEALGKLEQLPTDDARGDALMAMGDETRADVLEMLRRNACLVGLEPRFSMDGDDGTFPVRQLDATTLLRMFYENPTPVHMPPAVGDMSTFRESTAMGAAGSDGPAVRAEAE